MFQSASEADVETLSVESDLHGRDLAVVSLAGEMDLSNVGVAARAIEKALGHRDRLLVLDLQLLEFLDSSGIALLARMDGDGSIRGRVRVVPSSSPGVTRILAATGVGERLRTVEDGIVGESGAAG